MSGTVLTLYDVITPDEMARRISDQYITWRMFRQIWENERDEIRNYLFAVDTTTTTNDQVTNWNNKTHRPKLTQIRDNLQANYSSTLFPKKNFIEWEGGDEQSVSSDKEMAIRAYVNDKVRLSKFRTEAELCILNYIDDGNCFAMVEYIREEIEDPDGTTRLGYVGPKLRRISPYDIVFNPISPTFEESPKILRQLTTIGEMKRIVMTNPEEGYLADKIEMLNEFRNNYQNNYFSSDEKQREHLIVDGIGDFGDHIQTGNVELLHFYGDFYDEQDGKLYRNHVVTVADRTFELRRQPIETFNGKVPIFHCGWRLRSDNLYAMGPLDNLVGLQYRINHLENMKADVFDLTAYPPMAIKGDVMDFDWRPKEKIFLGDDGDVKLLQVDSGALATDLQIQELERTMEEMAGAPKEALGIRTPGEKTAFEVAKLDNAASRTFLNKTQYFEENFIEPILNAFLEIGRRNLTETEKVRTFDDETKAALFESVTKEDLTGVGAIRAVGARHFAQRAETLQNLVNMSNSTLAQDDAVKIHWSGMKIAEAIIDLLDLQGYSIYQPNVRVTELAETQRLMNSAQQIVAEEDLTPGIDESQLQVSGPVPGQPEGTGALPSVGP